MADESQAYEWSAALRQANGALKPVGVSYIDAENPDALNHVMDHYHAWRRDVPDDDVVLVRRRVGDWEVFGE